jgi:hypothetical protein
MTDGCSQAFALVVSSGVCAILVGGGATAGVALKARGKHP